MEIWKDVIGYNGVYKVSNFGTIKSIDHVVKAKNSTTRIQYGRIKKTSISKKGYIQVCLSKDGIRFHTGVHRLVAIAFIQNPLNLPQVNHKDGNKLNNNDWNLEWSTNKDNAIHASKNGLINPNFGEEHHLSKLKNKDVLLIRERYDNKESASSIHKDYKIISFTAFYNIITRKTYNKF